MVWQKGFAQYLTLSWWQNLIRTRILVLMEHCFIYPLLVSMEWCTKNELLLLIVAVNDYNCYLQIWKHNLRRCRLQLGFRTLCSTYFTHCRIAFLIFFTKLQTSAWWSLHVVPTSNWCNTSWNRFAIYLNLPCFQVFEICSFFWLLRPRLIVICIA